MKSLLIVLCVMLALCVSFSVNAQKKEKTFAGTIKYAITYEDLDPQYKSQVPTEMIMYIKDGKIRTDQVTPMYTMGAISLEDGSAIILMDITMMGQKVAFEQTKEDIEKAKAEAKEAGAEEKEPVIKVTDETKTIAGYKCTKIEVTYEGEEPMEVFVTEEIPMPASFAENSQIKGVKGVPMEYSVSQNGISMTMTVKEVKKGGVNNSMFVISDDYTKMSAEEFAKMFGGGM